jgi:hypothetical protein
MHDGKSTPRAIARRLALAVATVTTLLLVAAPGALAAKPVKEFLDGPTTIDLAAGEACAFPVRIDILVNNEYIKFFEGRASALADQISGRLVMRVTHGDRSVTLNVSGPGGDIYNDDGSGVFVFRGNGVLWAPTFMYAISGPASVTFGSDGSVLATDASKGHIVDLCALVG